LPFVVSCLFTVDDEVLVEHDHGVLTHALSVVVEADDQVRPLLEEEALDSVRRCWVEGVHDRQCFVRSHGRECTPEAVGVVVIHTLESPHNHLRWCSVLRGHGLKEGCIERLLLIDFDDTVKDVVEGLTERGEADDSHKGGKGVAHSVELFIFELCYDDRANMREFQISSVNECE